MLKRGARVCRQLEHGAASILPKKPPCLIRRSGKSDRKKTDGGAQRIAAKLRVEDKVSAAGAED